jgi:signal transduction histidine kinase
MAIQAKIKNALKRVGMIKAKSGALWHAGTALLSSTAIMSSASAFASDVGLRMSFLVRDSGAPIVMNMTGPVALLFSGMAFLTLATAVIHIFMRNQWSKRLTQKAETIHRLQSSLHRAETFTAGERHIVIAWGTADGEPEIEGDVSLLVGAGAARRVLGFSLWLPDAEAQRLTQCVEKLKERGIAFTLSVDGNQGNRLEIDGRAVTGRAIMRIREVSGDRLERIKAEENYGRLAGEMAALHAVLDALPQPIWLRYPDGRLAWVNRSYAEAVECRHPNEVISKGAELIERSDRDLVAKSNAEKPYNGRITAIVAGKRTQLEIVDARTPFGSGGIGHDVSEIELLRTQLEAEMATHVRTLNELPIAVAIFDRKQHLRFNNAAYQKLWGLDAAFLASNPAESEILDRLRADRLLPEQVDFRGWKQAILDGYQSSETSEHLWHLPDGRNLRVVSSPAPDGGLNYVYEDMTERMTMESQFKALSRVQNETLDNLKEAVAVFGSDGRLKLANAAFSTIWRLPPETLQDNPHIDEVIRRCPLSENDRIWTALHEAITALKDSRQSITLKEARSDHLVIECSTAPLPDGATLVTFADVTADENNSLFLQERNEALETAARVKNAFIQNVSYELRTPLQNVTMAVEMLADGTVGSLTQKQNEYAEAAKSSADSLLSLMNDIFDLASLDAGTLDLAIEAVHPEDEFKAVASALDAKLKTAGVSLVQDAAVDIGTFQADPQRIRQILFHLLANAIGFSAAGQTIRLSAERNNNDMLISIIDEGRGIPEDAMNRVFERFESHTEGSNHRGVGLGLAMVKAFVELHHGSVHLKTKEGKGTTVTCRFPLEQVQTAPQQASKDDASNNSKNDKAA